MQPVLLLIGLTLAVAIALLVMQIYGGMSARERIVRARIGADKAGMSFTPSSVLRPQSQSKFPLVAMLPISRESGERMSRELEQAGSSLRVGEYLAIRLLFALAVGAL